MAESKKFYWLKLQHDFFTSKRIKKLRTLEDGDTCVIVYLKMQLKSIRDGGMLTYIGLEDSFEEELALDLEEDLEAVKRTVDFLLKFDLMVELEPGEYSMPFAMKNTGSETTDAVRMREARKKKKTDEQSSNIVQECSEMFEQCATEKEIEVEVDKDKESEVDEEKKPEPKKKRENVIQVYERLNEEEFMFSFVMDEKIREWLKYKSERKESYKETGLHSLLKQIEKHRQQYGEAAMVDLIDKCMSSGWKGIIFDLLAKGNYRTNADRISSRVSEVDNW